MKFSTLTTTAALSALLPGALAKQAAGAPDHFSCGTTSHRTHDNETHHILSLEEKSVNDHKFDMGMFGRRQTEERLRIPTVMHAVVCEEDECADMLDRNDMIRQFNVMKTTFELYGIDLYLLEVTRTVNSTLAALNTDGEPTEADIAFRRRMRRGGYDTLNNYFYTDMEGGLGLCSFPKQDVDKYDFINDGCHNLGNTIPDPSTPDNKYNLGWTAVHEAGHWFNLRHTFTDGDLTCEGPGDFISDTPAQYSKTEGCPVGRDSCPDKPGLDPIGNFMDYSDDICFKASTGFTPMQRKRMHTSFKSLRLGRLGPGSVISN
jgi:hypothetical protein